jgi:transposase
MEREDGRKLTAEAKYERRKMVIRLYKQVKKMPEIVKSTGMCYSAVNGIVNKFKKEGADCIKPKKVGRQYGECRRLTPEQEMEIQRLIQDNRPEQIKMDFMLWTRPAVMALIKDKLNLTLPVRTVGEYLMRWGFTPQKPLKRAYEQNSAAVQKWLEEEYPAIATQAKAEGAEIQWMDETSLENTDARGRGYSPKGKTPVSHVPGKRERLNMISTVTNQGKTRWMMMDEPLDSDRLIEFLGALLKDSDRKLFVIMDNLGVHHCKPVKEWISERAKQIEAFYLPSYSPELNPDERLNADVKQGIGSRFGARTKERLKSLAKEHMQMLAANPDRVRKYFQDKRVAYAA